jgi:D-alanine-D-alanine ligase-like ATP-grasp enzyme
MKIERQQIKGYAYGAIQPSLILRFSDAPSVTDILTIRLAELRESLPSFKDDNRFSADSLLVDLDTAPAIYVIIIDILNHHCGDQRFTPIKLFEEGGALCFAIPTLSPAMSIFNANALQPLLSNMGRCMIHEDIIEFADKQKKQARRFLPAGTNAGNFIAAAAERKIPFNIFNQRYIIFGYGSGSSIFSSSITDQESAIGVTLAKSKVDTNRLLKMSGFPVAEQARVNTVEEAVSFAEKIGYPVVLKPEGEEQGRGVCTFLETENELVQTFRDLVKRYSNIIVERHCFGDAYRVTVLNNKIERAFKHEELHVFCDGVSSIRQLIDIENNSKERNLVSAAMTQIIIDELVIKILAKQQHTLSDVPPIGHKIILSHSSNVSRGGTTTDFNMYLHKENKLLCEQVAKTMGLYCAGVDLISVDASVPWYSNGAVICEVNAQPQLGSFGRIPLHDQMIKDATNARIPVSLTVVNQAIGAIASIFNKCDDLLTISMSVADIFRSGSPVQYFDRLEIFDDIPEDTRRKLEYMLVSVSPLYTNKTAGVAPS